MKRIDMRKEQRCVRMRRETMTSPCVEGGGYDGAFWVCSYRTYDIFRIPDFEMVMRLVVYEHRECNAENKTSMGKGKKASLDTSEHPRWPPSPGGECRMIVPHSGNWGKEGTTTGRARGELLDCFSSSIAGRLPSMGNVDV